MITDEMYERKLDNTTFIENNVNFKRDVFTNENVIEFVEGVSELPLVNEKTGDIVATLTDLLANGAGITYENISRVVFPKTLHRIEKGFLGVWYGDEDMDMFTVELDFSKCKNVFFESGAFTGFATDVLRLPEGSYVASSAFKNCSIEKLEVGSRTSVKTYAFYDCAISTLKIEGECDLIPQCFSKLVGGLHDLKIAGNVIFRTHDHDTRFRHISYYFDVQKAFLYSYSNKTSTDGMVLLGYNKENLFEHFDIADHFGEETCGYIREEEIPVLSLRRGFLGSKYFADFSDDLYENVGTDEVIWKDLAIGCEEPLLHANCKIPARPEILERLLLSNEIKDLWIKFSEKGLKKLCMIMAEGTEQIVFPEENSFEPITVICNKDTKIVNADKHSRLQVIRVNSEKQKGTLTCTIMDDCIKMGAD